MTTVESEQLITITPEAREVVMNALTSEDPSGALALYVEVTGIARGGYTYDLYFSEVGDASDTAVVHVDGDLTVVIPTTSADRLRGSRLEFSEEGGGGLILVNPNGPSPEEANPGVPADVLKKGLEFALAQQAIGILEAHVNPSIASHGGRADLVAFDDDKMVAFVRLSGGCQGCAMSRMTLSQGIEATLKEQMPALVGVVDVTDHLSGENPFYTHE